jgi:hypothetical protein
MAGYEGIHVVDLNSMHHRRGEVMREADVLEDHGIHLPLRETAQVETLASSSNA